MKRSTSAPVILVGALAWALAFLVAPHAAAAEPDRTQAPPPSAPSAWAPPAPTALSILGLETSLVERHELPIVELTFAWDVGRANDPDGKKGLHSMCLDLMDEATERLDQSALEDAKADLGATVAAAAGTEQSTLSVRVARERLPQTLDLVAQLLLEPALSPQDLERLRAQYKAAVLQQRGSVDGAARRVIDPVAWGRAHPFGRVATEQTLDAITRDDCARVATALRPQGARLLVVGDVTSADLRALVEERLGRWKGKAPRAQRTPAAKPAAETFFFVDVPGAAQSRIMVAHEGPARGDADYHANTLMAQVLGSGLPSRLVQNLRERNGFTYGARAEFDYARTGSLFMVSTSVRTDATGPALREIAAELRGMTERPVQDQEVARERDGGQRAFPSRFASNASTLGALAELAFFKLPVDTWAKTQAMLGAVTTADVRRAARERLKPDRVVVVVAGDRAQVWPELEKHAAEKVLGGRGLVELDADGRVVKR